MLPHRLATHTRSLKFAYSGLTGAAALAIALAASTWDGLSVGSFWWMALASLIVLGSLVVGTGVWTATGAYAVVFWCFHFGLIAVLATGLVPTTDISPWDQAWALGPFAGDAALLALAGSAAFAAGASLVYAWISRRRDRHFQPPTGNAVHPYGVGGSVLVLGATAIWCAIVVSTSGINGFFGSYSDYLQATADLSPILSVVWLALGCGIVMSVTGQRDWLRRAAIVAFACVAALALPLGLRGEILFPSIATLVAAARCGRTLSAGKACAFVATLLVVIPAAREVRNTGLKGLPDMVLELRLFDAFVEMGGSLHPVEKVVRWHAEGEPFEMGSSYWAPIERAAVRILPGLTSGAADDDMRIMNVLVTDRVGAIAFSPVAEAFRNFGSVGVVIVLALVGGALAALDSIQDRGAAVLAIATLYVPLLTNVRNSFVSVPMQCAVGALFVLALMVMRHIAASVLCRPYARTTDVRSEV